MKKQKKKIYIVPGFGESTRMKNYREVINLSKEKGFEVVGIKIFWDMDKTMDDYLLEVSEQLPNVNEDDYVLGFSFGAYIAYILSQKKVFNKYIFCTISPYFKENLKDIPQDAKDYFGEEFMKSLEIHKIHKGKDKKAWFFTGEKDWGLAIKMNKKASDKWKGESNFKLVKNTGHELSADNYIKELKNILKNLRA